MRIDNRKPKELRKFSMKASVHKYAEGSCLIKTGNTNVLCCASVNDYIPKFLKGTGKGWISAEYSMIPRASHTRSPRESIRGKIKGRTHEIQRLIGRSLRAIVDLEKLGERNIIVDCEVLQADGGTRTASVTGGFVALVLALKKLKKQKIIDEIPIKNYLAATSVGIVDNKVYLDLNYIEDSSAAVDMNLVMNDKDEFIEIQATGEEAVFNNDELLKMLEYGKYGIKQLIAVQKKLLNNII